MWESIVEIDREIFRFFNGLWIGEFKSFWVFVTQIQHWFPLYLLFFILIYKSIKGYKGFVGIGMVLTTAVFTLWLTNFVKNIVERLRPNNEPILMDTINILQTPENFSFWSGHSAVSFAVTTLVYSLLNHFNPSRWYLLFFIWPFLFAFSRLFVGVHYPADITVGMLVGIATGYLFYKLSLSLLDSLAHPAQR